MSLSTLALLLTSITLSACAQLLLKVGVTRRSVPGPGSLVDTLLGVASQPEIIGGLSLYGLGMVVWLLVLGRIELSQAYPFVGLGFVLTALFGAVFLQEAMTLPRLLGTALILGGVVLVAEG